MKKQTILTAGACILLASALSACKGRTTDTVEPDGDTVEVVINSARMEAAASQELPADTLNQLSE